MYINSNLMPFSQEKREYFIIQVFPIESRQSFNLNVILITFPEKFILISFERPISWMKMKLWSLFGWSLTKNHFFMILNDLKSSVSRENIKKMKVHSVIKSIHENRLYYGDFDQKLIFSFNLFLLIRLRRSVLRK